MRTSSKGINLIKEFEGIQLQKYRDSVGKWTIGVGHLILPNESFDKGITENQAIDLLIKDLTRVEIFINSYVTHHNLDLNQNEFDCFASFAFNLGVGSLDQLLSHGLNNVPIEILKWNHAGGVVSPGLSRRRQAELALFNAISN